MRYSSEKFKNYDIDPRYKVCDVHDLIGNYEVTCSGKIDVRTIPEDYLEIIYIYGYLPKNVYEDELEYLCNYINYLYFNYDPSCCGMVPIYFGSYDDSSEELDFDNYNYNDNDESSGEVDLSAFVNDIPFY